ncbi:MAG: hypothetical protein RIT02_1508, partial [Planctomycetota bacterium]
ASIITSVETTVAGAACCFTEPICPAPKNTTRTIAETTSRISKCGPTSNQDPSSQIQTRIPAHHGFHESQTPHSHHNHSTDPARSPRRSTTKRLKNPRKTQSQTIPSTRVPERQSSVFKFPTAKNMPIPEGGRAPASLPVSDNEPNSNFPAFPTFCTIQHSQPTHPAVGFKSA